MKRINTKFRLVLICFGMLLSLSVVAQNKHKQSIAFLDAHFEGGSIGFYKYIANNFLLPLEAIENEIVGIVLLEFKIDSDGVPVDFVFHNKVHPGLDKMVQQIVEKTSGRWKGASQDQSLILPMWLEGCIVKDQPADVPDHFLPLMKVTGGKACKVAPLSFAQMEEEINKSIGNNDYVKAIKMLNLLVMRNPMDKKIREKRIALAKQMDDNELLALDRTFIERFLP